MIERIKENLVTFGRVISKNACTESSPYMHTEISDVLLGKAKVVRDGTNEEGVEAFHLEYKDGKIGDFFNRKIAIEAPRDTAKSTLVAGFFVLHHLGFEEGNKYVVIQSKTLGEAKKRLRKIKNVLSYDDNFTVLFGYFGEDSPSVVTWGVDKITVRGFNKYTQREEEWTIEAKGYGQQTRGMKEDDQRVTLYILDDPEDEDNTRTEEAMNLNLTKFFVSMKAVTAKGQIIVIGTPIHQLCLVEKLKKMPGFSYMHYQTVNEKAKTSIWESHLPYKEVMKEKEDLLAVNKVSLWYSETQCLITGDEDQLFKEQDLRWWNGFIEADESGECILCVTHRGKTQSDLKELEKPELIPVYTYMGIDPASSTSKKADFSVTMPIAYSANGDIYVLPYFEKQVRPTEHADDIMKKLKQYYPQRTHVETVSYQEMLRDVLIRRFEDSGEPLPRGLHKKFTPKANESKDERLSSLEDFVTENKVHLMPFMDTLRNEMTLFPRGRKNLLDGLWYATRKLWRPYHTIDSVKANKSENNEDHLYISYIGKKRFRQRI